MDRRAFPGALGGVPWLASAVYGAAQDKVPRIGFLARLTPDSEQKAGFQEGLRELGYFDGTNILIEWRNTLICAWHEISGSTCRRNSCSVPIG